ncbi:60 kDa lysophospholipase [Protopterus annectens]|uniref:60 kDa lysophospholipase n=1 Tax=Protopterus annectens TaxID=7888 RepID=UPI001CF9D7E9|nr:60 kDa lysophospholipase [Protopterus annectens]
MNDMAEEKLITLNGAAASTVSECSFLCKALSARSLDKTDTDLGISHGAAGHQVPRRRRVPCGSSYNSGSQENLPSPVSETRVLVINTGGTIGMTYQDDVLSPEANTFAKALKKLPTLHDEVYAQQTKLYERCDSPDDTMVLPMSKQNKRIVYTVIEYSSLLDSSNMTPADWAKIAMDIKKHYERYDGFVVLHGTDTMAYTASALSFMCEHLGKSIVLTGSQVPIYEMWSDGRDNLLGALLIAGLFVIPEVTLYFYHKLYRGNRVTKVDSGSFNAFTSPNLSPLANAEVDIQINWDAIWRANTTKTFFVETNLNRNVGLLRIFPGITTDTVKAFLQPPMEGIVLETYGSGNAPDQRSDLLEEIKKATKRGTFIINCTQCLRGSVTESYATGKALGLAGVIQGGDMTPEAALAKLSYVLGKNDLSHKQKKKMLSENLRGEMTLAVKAGSISLRDSKFIQVIAKSLNVSSKEELKAVRDALIPPLACAAAKTGDISALEAVQELGGNLSSEDYDGRTPLHVAACEGHLAVIEYLLKHGATVYAKDRYGNTPLKNATKFRKFDVIQLLRKTGAHLSFEEQKDVGNELCSLAAGDDFEGLEAWSQAGVSLTLTGYDGKTPLEVVLNLKREDIMSHESPLEELHFGNTVLKMMQHF